MSPNLLKPEECPRILHTSKNQKIIKGRPGTIGVSISSCRKKWSCALTKSGSIFPIPRWICISPAGPRQRH